MAELNIGTLIGELSDDTVFAWIAVTGIAIVILNRWC